MREREYSSLRDWLAAADLGDLAEAWAALEPMQKLVSFKLLPAPRALEFYAGLSVDEKYFLLCAFDLGSISPVLEELSPEDSALFVELPPAAYDRMLHLLCGDTVEFEVAVGTN